MPIESFAHNLTAEDIDLDTWVCKKCFIELYKDYEPIKTLKPIFNPRKAIFDTGSLIEWIED